MGNKGRSRQTRTIFFHAGTDTRQKPRDSAGDRASEGDRITHAKAADTRADTHALRNVGADQLHAPLGSFDVLHRSHRLAHDPSQPRLGAHAGPREYLFGALGIRGCGDLLEEIRQLHRAASNRRASAEKREKAAVQEDATLYELVTLARGGDRQAERVLVQLLIPAAQRMAHRVTRLGDFDRADRVGYAIGAAWESIRSFKLHLRRRIHANLTMGMLSILAPEKTQNEKLIHDCTAPVSDEVLEQEAGEWQQPEKPVEVQLAQLFTWAIDTGVLQRDEVALLSTPH